VTSRGSGDVTARQVRVDLRWSRPAEPAGIVSAYHVYTTTTLNAGSEDSSWNVSTVAGEQPLATKFTLVNAPANTILHFKVSNINMLSYFFVNVVYDSCCFYVV